MLHPAPAILVVEPHRDTRSLIDVVLSGAGYRITTAASHEDGVAALSRVQPDLIVTGARLPGMPLFSLVDHLRAERHTRRLPVLLCTTAVSEARARYGDTYDPHTAVIFKPFDIDDLVAATSDLLRQTTRAAAYFAPLSIPA